MPSTTTASFSSSEVPGFEIVRELGRGPHGPVYEARQTGLDRRVALKLLEPGAPLSADWPEHPRIARLYATGPHAPGRYAAVQLIEGPRLSGLDRKRRRAALTDAAAALDAAHAAGVAHGAVHAGNVLVDRDGRGYLTDFTGRPDATAEADREAFARLVRTQMGRPWRSPALVVAVILLAVVGLRGLLGSDGDERGRRAVDGRLTGAAAAQAPAGQRLDWVAVEVRPGVIRHVAVVRTADGIALDLFAGRRRLERLPVPDAASDGRLDGLSTLGEPTAGLRWRNPDGSRADHDYGVGLNALTG